MFGLMRPDEALLDGAQRARHRRYYCGLCHGVGTHVGQGWRAIHSHDAVFVATVVDGLVDDAAGSASCRCPALPMVRRDSRDPGSTAIRFAVGLQLLLADQWVADKAEEGSRAARFARDVLAQPVARGVSLLDGLQVDLTGIEGVEVRQREAEEAMRKRKVCSVTTASAPTEAALGAAFRAIARLPGAPAHKGATLQLLGRSLGRAIYLLDALEDLADDAVEDAFNPCLVDGVACPLRVTRARRALFAALTDAEQAIEGLPWYRNRDLVEATVSGLRTRAFDAAEAAAGHATPTGQASLSRWSAQPRWVHAMAAVMTLWTAGWAVFGSVAQAAGRQLTQTGIRVAPDWLFPQAKQCPCDNCAAGCDGCAKGCDSCGQGCGDCGKTCNDCGSTFNDCMTCGWC